MPGGSTARRKLSTGPFVAASYASRMLHDPIEDHPATKRLIAKAEREAEAELLREGTVGPGQIGYCHALWEVQQRILRERHGITWRTPAEMNPDVLFD